MILLISFSLYGRKTPATGPTTKAHMTVPRPKVPPSQNPVAAKRISTIIRTGANFILDFSLMTRATRSLGPVPASDLITMVIP